MTIDDADAQAFAQKRRWYQTHVVAAMATFGICVATPWFPRAYLMFGPCIAVAAAGAAISGRCWSRDGDSDIDGVELRPAGRVFAWITFGVAVVLTAWTTLSATGIV